MAVPLREYKERVGISQRTTGVELNPRALTAPNEAMERAIQSVGSTVDNFIDTKRKAKNASDRNKAKADNRAFKTELTQAKIDYLQQPGADYTKLIDEVYTPAINEYSKSISQKGYLPEVQQEVEESFNIDAQEILGAEILALDAMEYESYQNTVKQGLVDTYIETGNSTLFKEESKDLLSFMTQEDADRYVEGIRVSYIEAYGQAILNMPDEVQQDEALLALRKDLFDSDVELSPSAKLAADAQLSSLNNKLYEQRYKQVRQAVSDVESAILTNTFDYEVYKKARTGLPVYQQELLDQMITEQAFALTANPDSEANAVIDVVKQYREGLITPQEAFEAMAIDREIINKKGKVETVKGKGNIFSTQAQALFFVLMNETMESQTSAGVSLGQFGRPTGEKGFFVDKMAPAPFTIGNFTGDFIDTLFTVNGAYLDNPVGYMTNAFAELKDFLSRNPNPTADEYLTFKKDVFKMATVGKIQSITGTSLLGEGLKPSDRQFLLEAREQ
jgi:hypothetical protein